MANTQLITRCRHLLATALLLLSGAGMVCAQQWHTTIELSHPAEISLPLEVSDLLLVNNTVAHPDLPTGAFYTLMAAAETLEGSDYLPSVLETSQNSSGSLYRKQLLSNTQADSLLTLYQSQALLVLNQLIVHPSTEGFPTDNDTYYACMQAIAVAYSDWKCSTTFTSLRSRSTPRWNVLSIEGFTPLRLSPVAMSSNATCSLRSVGTHDPVPDTRAFPSSTRHERLPLLQSMRRASP